MGNASFWADMRRYMDDEGTPCDFVEDKSFWKDYEDMTEAQLQYYLYWRGSLRRGESLKANSCHIRLVVEELLNMPRNMEDTTTVLKALGPLMDADHRDEMMIIATRMFAMGEPLEDVPLGTMLSSEMAVCDAFNRLPRPMSSSVLNILLGNDWKGEPFPEDLRAVVSRSLGLIIDRIGADRFRQVFGCQEVYVEADSSTLVRLKGVDPMKGRILHYNILRLNNCLISFMSDLVDSCRAVMGGDGPGGYPYGDIIRSVVDGTACGCQGGYMCLEFVDRDVPLCIQGIHVRYISQFFRKKQVLAMFEPGSDAPCPYVPSIQDQTVRLGRKEVKQYYRYWKRCISEGRYPVTDTGYVWVRFMELTESDLPFEQKVASIRDLADHYIAVKVWMDNALCRMMLDRGEYPDSLTGNLCSGCSCVAMDSVVLNDDATATADGLRNTLAMGWRDALYLDDGMADMFCRCIRHIADMKVDERDEFFELLDIGEEYVEERYDRWGNRFDSWMGFGREMGVLHLWCGEGAPDAFVGALVHDIVEVAMSVRDGRDPDIVPIPKLEQDMGPVIGFIRSLCTCGKVEDGRMGTEEFLSRMRELADSDGHPAEYVPSIAGRPDYDSLSEEQLQYYLHWRSGIRRGEPLRGDHGYIWLMLNELCNTDVPMDVMRRMVDAMRRGSGSEDRVLDEFMCDWCVVHNERFITVPRGILATACVQDLLSHPVRDLDVRAMRSVLSEFDYDDMDDVDDGVAEDIIEAIMELDASLYSETGAGLMDNFPGRRTEVHHNVFCDLPHYRGNREYRVLCVDDLGECHGGDLAALICQMACDIADDGTSDVPERILAEASGRAHPGIEGRMRTVKVPRNDTTTPFCIMHEKCLYAPFVGYYNDLEFPEWDRRCSPVPYVPCELSLDDIRFPRQETYYIYWRGLFMDGVYAETDAVYVSSLIADIILSRDVGEVMDLLLRIETAYGQDDPMIRDGIVFFARCKGIPLPGYLGVEPGDFHGNVLDEISHGHHASFSAKGLYEMMGGEVDMSLIGPVQTEVVGRCLERISELCDHKVRGFREALGISVARSTYYGPPNMRINGSLYCVDITVRQLPKSTFRKDVIGCVRYSRWKETGERIKGMPRIPRIGCLGKEDIDSIVESVLCTMRPREIVLDTVAVESAERDLEHVTDMMKIDDGSDPVPPATDVPEGRGPCTDPWGVLSASLTRSERDYLAEIIGGASGDDLRIDDSINAKAMDSLNDVIIECGALVGDYEDDVRRIMAGGSPMDGAVREFLASLSEDESDYVIGLSSGVRPKGRRPVKRIGSINAKAEATIGHHVISDGTMDGQVSGIIIRMKECE